MFFKDFGKCFAESFMFFFLFVFCVVYFLTRFDGAQTARRGKREGAERWRGCLEDGSIQ